MPIAIGFKCSKPKKASRRITKAVEYNIGETAQNEEITFDSPIEYVKAKDFNVKTKREEWKGHIIIFTTFAL